MMAEEVRDHMAQMGFRTFEEMVGRADMLRVDESALHSKSATLDLGPILTPAASLAPGEPQFNAQGFATPRDGAAGEASWGQDHFSKEATMLDELLDDQLIASCAPALERGEAVALNVEINNLHRSVGAMLSHEVSKRYGGAGLPDGTITVQMKGHTGQSFGFTLTKGVRFDVQGDANDGCGKGLSGGEISVSPVPACVEAGFEPKENVVVGNVALYGATGGRAFFRGKGGERFCVRNSGATAVVEGVGDHGCEYMTGGRMICLGETGINFGAGMSGGVAYIYDPADKFPANCNPEMVSLETVEPLSAEAAELRSLLETHVERTGSDVAATLLSDWEAALPNFVKVMPDDYKAVLQAQAAQRAEKGPEAIAAAA
jgi:glutamate synthase domain-containing protein 3